MISSGLDNSSEVSSGIILSGVREKYRGRGWGGGGGGGATAPPRRGGKVEQFGEKCLISTKECRQREAKG